MASITNLSQDELWHRYLYGPFPREALASIARSLSFFRFCRAFGGHNNDGDQLLVALRVQSEDDLRHIFQQLQIPLLSIPANPDPLVDIPIAPYPTLRQPGYTTVQGLRAHVWVTKTRVEISVADSERIFEVSQAAVERARALEQPLQAVRDRVEDPPLDDKHCICPKYYPDFWA